MSNASDFIIENGKLLRYTGSEECVQIPETVNVIGAEAFHHKHRECFKVPFKGTAEAWNKLTRNQVKRVEIPASVLIIERYAFCKCHNLVSVVFEEGVQRLCYGAFFDCSSLEQICVPDSVNTIEDDVFALCESLKAIEISDVVVNRIGAAQARKTLAVYSVMKAYLCDEFTPSAALEGILISAMNLKKNRDKLLEDLWIEQKTNAIQKLIGTQQKIKLDDIELWITQSEKHSSVSLKTFFLETKARLFDISTIEEQTRDELEKELGLQERTISDWRKIFTVSFVDGLTLLGKYKGAEETMVVPAKVGKHDVYGLDYKAFAKCETIKEVYISNGVKSIGANAFQSCPKLKELHLPGSVEWIGEKAISKRVKILAPAGSYAETYAKENNIPFVAE